MDTAHSPSLRSFDGSSLNGSDISISEPCSPGTPNTTDGALGLHDTTLPGTHVGAGLPSDRCVKHSRFYFPDGSLSLQVQGITYKVQGSLLALHSEHWARMLRGLTRSEGLPPATLDTVSVTEMDAFLSILYPISFSRAKGPTVSSLEDWSAVLRLATMWSCKDIRTLAIEQLSQLAPPIDKLVLSRAHDVIEWRVPAYVALCLRPQTLSESEAERLAVRDIVRITAAREAIRDGRVAATQDALTHYVLQHNHADTRMPEHSFQPDATVSSELFPSPIVTETPYTADERARIFTQLSQKKYVEAISNISPPQISPFCSILQESWGARITEFPVQGLVRAILHRGSINPGPAFVPTGIQLLRAISALIRTGPFETEFPAPQFLDLIISRDIRALRDTWSSYEASRARLCTLNGHQKAHHAAYDDTFSSAARTIYPRGAREDWELYITKTSFLKDFVNAIVDAGLVKATVLQS